MTRINLMPGAPSAAPAGRVRPKLILRSRKPLTKRELVILFDRIKKRLLKGGEPFGVFVIKHGRGRVFRLLGIRDPNFVAQLRVDRAQQHMVCLYDKSVDLGEVWGDLCAFDCDADRHVRLDRHYGYARLWYAKSSDEGARSAISVMGAH